jgi:MFS family permease
MTQRRAWTLVALLWLVALLNYVDRQVIFSVFPLLSTDLGLSNIQLGFLSTVFLWTYGLLSPVAGYVADRFGRARLITIGLLVWSGRDRRDRSYRSFRAARRGARADGRE